MSFRVAFDMTPTIGTRTGIGNVVLYLYDALKSMGSKGSSDKSYELSPYTLSYKARSFSDELPENNIFIPYPARVLLFAWKYSSAFSLDRTMDDCNLWHATNYLAPPTHLPLLITIHDVTMAKYPDLVSTQIRSLIPMLQKRMDDGAHIQVPAQAIKKDVLNHFNINKDRVHVIPFATPDLIEGKPSNKINKLCEGDPYILSIGALEPRKNHARLINAFGHVFQKNPHVRLFLVGPDGPARPQIDAAMAALPHKARSRVVITGKVSDVDRTHLLKNAYMLAYPSLYEGFGLPVLEAMTAHIPIVTTKEGSLEEVGGNAAYFVDPHNVDNIAHGLLDVLESADMRSKLISQGNKRIEDFSWEKSAIMFSELYRQVMRERAD